MERIVLAIAVAALLLSVLLVFAYAALLRIVREMQAASSVMTPAAVSEPLRQFSGPGNTLVLVVAEHCPACVSRIADLERLVATQPAPVPVVLLSQAEMSDTPAIREVRQLVDPALVGQLRVSVTPTAILFDQQGQEFSRSIIGSEAALASALYGPSEPAARANA
jgi:hypothetical protein